MSTPFRLSSDNGTFSLSVLPEFNVRPLRMAPPALEDFLTLGRWVIVVFAVWGTPDLKQLSKFIHMAQQASTCSCKFAARPFDDYGEIATWCPGVVLPKFHSPVWLSIQEGRVHGRIVGIQRYTSIEQLCARIEAHSDVCEK